MKITVVNGLLANENEMKKILDLVVNEFDKYDLMFNYVDLAEEKLNTFGGISNSQMDQIFNKILVADAVIFATSIHMGNITPLMQNLFNYFEMGKYKSAMQNKNVLSVVIHNTDDEIIPYTVMMNFYKKFNAYEVNKLFLNIPDVITNEFLDKTCKYIKSRTKEFASLLVPTKVENVEMKNINSEKINEMLESKDLVYNENQLTLEKQAPAESDIKELTGMVNDKLKVQSIIKEEPKEKVVTEITQKYKTKIEQMMQETLFGDDDDEEETVAERMFENAREEKELNETKDNINFKRNVEERKDEVKSPSEEKVSREENESLDSLIARVVARTKEEKEKEREIEAQRVKEALATREKPFIPRSFNEEVSEEQVTLDVPEEIEDEHEMTFEEEYNVQDNYMDGQISLEENKENEQIEFVRMIKKDDDELKNSANEINEIKFMKEVVQDAKVNEDTERFEPDSIRELRKKLNSIKMQRDEIVNEVSEMKKEMDTELKEVEEQKVSISKFALEDFNEPHEVIKYEETPSVKVEKKSNMSLKDMTKNLVYLFKTEDNDQMKALVQINVEGDEGFNLYLNILDGKCTMFDGVNMNNDITIYVKDDKWRSILDGEVTLQRAFMTGLVKVTGNFMLLNKLDNTLLAYNK
ncbi:MAG: SCP2 sterol-binding domain-containing protein [Clostridia bacterium]|nr:SCP2 sterol-binding domain-containing protein [Clostridia bacterium]